MADTGIFTTGTKVKYKAGAKASTISTAEAYTNEFISLAESIINVKCKYNFSDAYASLNADVKGILSDAASNLAAIYCINYDISNYQPGEAQFMIQTLKDSFERDIEILNKIDTESFVTTA